MTRSCSFHPQLQAPYLHEKVEVTYPWLPDTKNRLNNCITTLVAAYAKCVTHGDLETAEKQLRVHQREHVSQSHSSIVRPNLFSFSDCMGARYSVEADDRARKEGREWPNQGHRRFASQGTPTSSYRLPNPLGKNKIKQALGVLPGSPGGVYMAAPQSGS